MEDTSGLDTDTDTDGGVIKGDAKLKLTLQATRFNECGHKLHGIQPAQVTLLIHCIFNPVTDHLLIPKKVSTVLVPPPHIR